MKEQSNVIFVDFVNKRRIETKLEGPIGVKLSLSTGGLLKVKSRIDGIATEMDELYRQGFKWGDEPLNKLQDELTYLRNCLNKLYKEAL
jgi:hypothetical protein